MKRRTFLRSIALSVGTAGVACQPRSEGSPASQATRDRPNILLIMTDQQIAEGLSCLGNPYVRTPALDSLAAEGTIFRKSYVTQPLCSPFRTSLQTGRYPHETGVVTNKAGVERRHPMMGRLLADAGYDCAYFGKWHVGVDEKEVEVHGYPIMEKGEDSTVPAMAVQFMQQKREQPFFLTASFVNPHDVCQLARGEELPGGPIPPLPPLEECPPLPENFAIPPREPSAIREAQRLNADFHYPTSGWDEARWREYLWGYYRLIEKVDREIATVLDGLRGSGKGENTLVVFTSDHGEGVAAHHWNQKQILYDETSRVPFIIGWKGVLPAGEVNGEHLVSTGIDILPTFLEAAGLPVPAELPGRSLLDVAAGKVSGGWRDYLVVETAFAQGTDHTGISGRMVRSNRWKYVLYNTGENREQLFDMEKDPGEMNNLAGDSAFDEILKDHREKLAEWSRLTQDEFPLVTSS